MDRKEAINKSVAFLVSKGYHIQTQTENLLVFQSDKRELNSILVFVLCCLGILPAVIYYFGFAPKHQVTVSISGEKSVTVTVTGNTSNAKKDAEELSKTLG